MAYLLYDIDYPEVINDARTFLYDYNRDHSFDPEKLHHSDFHIEGSYGLPIPIEVYDAYIEGGDGHTIFFFNRKSSNAWLEDGGTKKFLEFARKTNSRIEG